jgi:hypothetical protein
MLPHTAQIVILLSRTFLKKIKLNPFYPNKTLFFTILEFGKIQSSEI